MNEHRRKQGNITDTEPLGDVCRASGRQGLIFFGKSILCILVHWDGPGVYVCLEEPSKGHPDPAQSHLGLGKGTVWAQCSSAQHIPAGGAHPAGFLGRVLCMGLCFFLTGLKEEEEKQNPVWLVWPDSSCHQCHLVCALLHFSSFASLSPSPLVWRLLKPFCPQQRPDRKSVV